MTRGLRRGRSTLVGAAVLCLLVGPAHAAGTRDVVVSPSSPVTKDVLAEVDAYLARNREEHGWPGLAAAIVADGEVAWSAGYGSTGPDGDPVMAQTPFLLASVGKSLTALAVMRLVDA